MLNELTCIALVLTPSRSSFMDDTFSSSHATHVDRGIDIVFKAHDLPIKEWERLLDALGNPSFLEATALQRPFGWQAGPSWYCLCYR